MHMNIDMQDVTKKIDLGDGSSVVLLDTLGKQDLYGRLECARNVFLIDAGGKVVWQIRTNFDAESGPFTNIFPDGSEIKGYRWDGGTYVININDGEAMPGLLMK
jgi:hypothetical protein